MSCVFLKRYDCFYKFNNVFIAVNNGGKQNPSVLNIKVEKQKKTNSVVKTKFAF